VAEKKIKNNPQATSCKLHEPGKPGVVGVGGFPEVASNLSTEKIFSSLLMWDYMI